MPHFLNDTQRWTTFEFDEVGRLISETFEGLTTTFCYSSRPLGRQLLSMTTITDPRGRVSNRFYNLVGDLIISEDAMEGSVTYGYYAPGFVRWITAPGNAITEIVYDKFGRQEALIEPNAGRIEFVYDAFDRIVRQTDARGNITENEFDNLGRLRRTVITNATTGERRVTTHTYITGLNNPNVGRLQSITVNDGVNNAAHIFEYDRFGRITKFKDVIGTDTLITRYTYCDAYGRLLTYTFPSGFTLHYTYDANGFKIEIRENNSTGKLIWQLDSVNAMGQELSSRVGTETHNRIRTQAYNVFGQPTAMIVGELRDYTFRPHQPPPGSGLPQPPHWMAVSPTLMDFTYTYDSLTGNMLSRHNRFNGTNEEFQYDALNRLTTGITFSLCGNITWKEGVGYFSYNSNRPHAVDYILGMSRQLSNHDITYTGFQKIETIEDTANGLFASFIYGPNRQRRQMTVWFDNNMLTKHYTQNFEVSYIDGVRKETKEYIFSPFGLVAIRNNNVVNAVATDHLGSIVAEFNPRRNAFEFFGFTAWGRRYRYENGTKFFFDEKVISCQLSVVSFFQRGFTGHEHMDAFGLINMNGRLYDPLIGRFLSPDPFVPDATFTQDFNRYMYARNNPLSYIDPTGEIVWFVPIIIGAVVGGVSGGIIAHNNGGEWWQGALIGAGIGALSGGTAVGVSALGGGAMLAGASAGAVGGAGFSGLATDWNGEAMLRGATFGAISGFVGGGFASAIGGGWGALAGGASANLTNQLLYNGGDFSQVNWASVGFGAGLSFGMYHGMQYWQYKAMGGRLGPMDITYRQFARMNTAYQRSRFWQREYGVVFNRDGSARLVRGNRYDVTMVVRPRDGEFATAHTHWARAGRDVVVNGQPFTTVGGYHSPQDLKIPGFSVVIGRTTSTYSIGTGVSHFIRPDPFIRFHLFPFLSLRR